MQPNMRQASAQLPPPILTYSLTTQPLPVQVSLSTTSPSIATLIFVVSCPLTTGTPTDRGTATVAGIEIILPVDSGGTPDPTNLCMTPPPASSPSISSSDGEAWSASSLSPGVFLFTPDDETGSVVLKGQSLTIELSEIKINTLVGTAIITINEWAVPGKGDPPSPDDDPPTGQMSMAVAKFPYGFYAGNFTSDKPMVKNGESPVLSWMGSSGNATYLMLYESNSVDVSNVQTWSPPGLTQMTTFILQVSAQENGQTATMDFTLTVEVENPSLIAQDLTVLTTSTLQGAVNVGASGAPANLVVNGGLTAAGPLNAQAVATIATLNVTGVATLSSTLNVIGGVTLGNTLNVTGVATFSGGLTSNNGLTAGGVVSVYGTRQQLGPGSYKAGTDGFVFGVVYPPSLSPLMIYYDLIIYCIGNMTMAWATGGGTMQANAGSTNYVTPNGNSFLLPIPKNGQFTLVVVPPSRNPPPKPIYEFWWFPFGSGPLTPVQTTSKKRRGSKKLKARNAAAKKMLATSKKPTTKKKLAKKSRKR